MLHHYMNFFLIKIIDLKAELLKKQEEYKLKKLDKAKNNEYEVISSKIKVGTENSFY